ncbi:MAG: UDP-3-O-acylglucosamine N-acyltransferase [Candidatus Hydrogenedentota bacterium]
MKATVAEIAGWLGGSVIGDGTIPISGVNGIRDAAEGDLTFLYDSRYAGHLGTTQASAILVGRSISEAPKPLIQVENPYAAMVMVLRQVEAEFRPASAGIHPSASLGEGVTLGSNVSVGPQAVLEDGCTIGENTVIGAGVFVGRQSRLGRDCTVYANVVLRERVTLGDRCIIHSGAVIGSDGFGFLPHEGRHVKIPQVGTVILGDDVEVGTNSAIDRGTMGATRIGSGTKIDNLVQIGHNVRIGQNCILCGNAGIAGSAILGDNVTIAAGAGVNGHVEVGDRAIVAAYSGTTNSVKSGEVVFGYPAVEIHKGRRMHAALRNLPDALRRIRDLEDRLVELENKFHGKTEDNC